MSQFVKLGENEFISKANCVATGQDFEDFCEVFFKVECPKKQACHYSIKSQTNTEEPHPVILGHPYQDQVSTDQAEDFYYMTVAEGNVREIEAIITVMTGSAAIYATYETGAESLRPEDWAKPTKYDYKAKSFKKMNSQKLTLNQGFVEDCFKEMGKKAKKSKVERTCGIVFGVINQDDSEQSSYTLVVYEDIMTLVDRVAVTGFVGQDTMDYYKYETSCEGCSLQVSLSTRTSGATPALYIIKGDARLPTADDYNIYEHAYGSDLLEIESDDPIHEGKGTAGIYMVGVKAGTQPTSYQLIIQATDYPVNLLYDAVAVTSVQQSESMRYFRWYNFEKEESLAIKFDVKYGHIKVRLSQFVPHEDNQSYIGELPKTDKEALLTRELNSLSLSEDTEIVIHKTDKKLFCVDCYYLIGVEAFEIQSQYKVEVDSFDPTEQATTTQALQINEPT
jgi:hypothetical protein